MFLTDALSVLQAYSSGQLPSLDKALSKLRCFRAVLQWVPSHCGISGNEKADNLAKQGSRDNHTNRPVSIEETTTIIKSILRNRGNTRDNYPNLSRKEQVIIFRLRTGHNRLNCTTNWWISRERHHLFAGPVS